MERIRSAAVALVALLLGAAIFDPYGWHLWVTYHTSTLAWWKLAISALDILLLTLLGSLILRGRWRHALRLSMLEYVFAATAGLFLARQDLIRNAIQVDWLAAIRVLLAIYIGSLALRLVVILLLARADGRSGRRFSVSITP